MTTSDHLPMVRAVIRLMAILLVVLFALAVGVEAACMAGANEDCDCDSCVFCSHDAVVDGDALPTGLVGNPQSFTLAPALAPLAPDLGRWTPPPRF